MAYTNEGNIEKYLGVDITGISTFITSLISMAKQIIDNYCGKSFEAASDTKYYDGNGRDRIYIDSFVGTPTSVQILEQDGDVYLTLSEGADNDYLAYPLNETEKNELRLTDNASVGTFLSGLRRLKVTASFGAASTVPADIELVATMLVARIVEKSLKGGELTSAQLADYKVTFKNIKDEADILGVYTILDRYRDVQI